MNTRREAIFALSAWLETSAFPDRFLGDGEGHAFAADLVLTTVRRKRSLEWALKSFVKKTPHGETLAALLAGAAQLLFMPDVADHAALHETVEAAKLASRRSAPFVNAVLRSIQRNRENLLRDLARQPLGVRESHPGELVRRWTARYGESGAEALCRWNNLPAETYLAYPPDAPERFVKLPRGKKVADQPGYAEGAFIVQDPATASAVDMLGAKPGMRVLDACSAPGGKTIQIAWRMRGQGVLTAMDLHEDRLEIVRNNLSRTLQSWVKTLQCDLANTAVSERYDCILLDAPCSNSGVLRRRADARWRWSAKRMHKLAEKQAQLLRAAAKLLAPDGTLVYSTCSIEPEENEEQIASFLRENPQFKCTGRRLHFPPADNTDGAFAAAIRFA